MVISAEPLIYGLIFIAVLALVQGIYLTVFGKSISLNNRVNRRLEMLEKGAPSLDLGSGSTVTVESNANSTWGRSTSPRIARTNSAF